MRETTTGWTLAILVIGLWVAITSAPAAQSDRPDGLKRILVNGPRNVSPVGTGSPRLVRGRSMPVLDESGARVATANLTGVIDDPDAPYYATVVEIRNDNQYLVLTELVSRDRTFSRSFGYERVDNRPTAFFEVGMLIQEDGSVIYSLTRPASEPIASPIVDNILLHKKSPTDRIVGDTTIRFRPETDWLLVTGPSQATAAGTNFNWTSANADQSVIVNYLARPDGQHGWIVACTAAGPTCGYVGVGAYADRCGYAESRTPGSYGLVADAASALIPQCRYSNINLPPLGCPEGQPPATAPANLIAAFGNEDSGELLWAFDSVPCATAYRVEFFDDRGLPVGLPSESPRTRGLWLQWPRDLRVPGIRVRVVPINAAGRGPFSEVQVVFSDLGR